jgi:hypothetical protein
VGRPIHIQSNVLWPGSFKKKMTKKGKAIVTTYQDSKGVKRVVGNKLLKRSAFDSSASVRRANEITQAV